MILKFMTTGVKCDEEDCDWKESEANYKDWVNESCPACGRGIIINQREKDFLDGVQGVCDYIGELLKNQKPKPFDISHLRPKP